MRLSIRPTRRALALAAGCLALFAVGTNVQAGWVLAIAALLAGVLVTGAILPLRALSGLDIARRVPRTAHAGQPIGVTLAVTNSSRRPRALVKISDDFCGTGTALVTFVGPGGTTEYRGTRGGARRGVYVDGTCKLETGFPFGVLRVRDGRAVPSPIVVYPAVYNVGSSRTSGGAGSRALSPYGDVASVRDYHRGDPLRHVHWRSVARRGQLVVREFDRERRDEVTIAAEVPASPDSADAVASVACSLALAAMRDGADITLLSPDRPRRLRARTPDDVLDWGARLSPSATQFGPQVDEASSVICVCPAGTGAVDDLCAMASNSSLRVVFVGDPGGAVMSRLRGAGAAVDSVGAEEIESWLASASAVS